MSITDEKKVLLESDKKLFTQQLRKTKREGIENLLSYLETTDFYTAPASSKFHGSWEGGLLSHSVNVLDAIYNIDKNLYESYKIPQDEKDSLTLVALLHDLTKIGNYKMEQAWRKDENGKWESYMRYNKKEPLPMGHSSKSLFLIMQHITLTNEEAQAIFWHMGPYDVSEYNSFNALGKAFEENTLAFKLHSADMMATYILENPNLIVE